MRGDYKILLHITWEIDPVRVPKGSYQRISPLDRRMKNHVICVVHDEEDKARFKRDIGRIAKDIQVIRNPEGPPR